MASVDVKTAFDVAKPSVVPRTVDGCSVAEMQDVRACFNETEFSPVLSCCVA